MIKDSAAGSYCSVVSVKFVKMNGWEPAVASSATSPPPSVASVALPTATRVHVECHLGAALVDGKCVGGIGPLVNG